MHESYILLLLLAIPIVATIMIYILPQQYRLQIGTGVVLVYTLTLYKIFAMLALYDNIVIKFRNISILRVDNISMYFIILSIVLMFLSILATQYVQKYKRELISLILFSTIVSIGIFMATYLISIYILFEISMIPIFFMIAFWGGKEKIYACFKFFVYTAIGSVPMLIGIIHISILAPEYNTDLRNISNIPHANIVVILVLIACAIKLPIPPLHSWLPLAHVEAPTSCSILLAGVMLKIGGYIIIRIILPLLNHNILQKSLIYIGAITIIYTSFVALRQTNIKKMIAYSSIAHMGYVTIGLFSMTQVGYIGAIFQMISHGLISGSLFFMVGVLYNRTNTMDIKSCSGIAQTMPKYAAFFTFFAMANIGIPATSGFIGEWLTIFSLMEYGADIGFIAFAASGSILGAVYMLYLVKATLFGKAIKQYDDLTKTEFIALLFMAILIILLGIFPTIINNTKHYNVPVAGINNVQLQIK